MDKNKTDIWNAGKYSEIILGILIISAFYLISRCNFLLFHSIVEIFCITVSFTIFIIAWNTRQFMDNNYIHFLSIAYLFIGILDMLHTLAYKGMGVFQGEGADLPTQLWIIARYIQGASFLTAPFFLKKKHFNLKLTFISYAVFTGILLISVFYLDCFPACFIEGKGLTLFKKISEYVISLILLGSVILLFKNRMKFDPMVFNLLIQSIFFSIASELSFTFYVSVYGFSNIVGHFFKFISVLLIYKAIVKIYLIRPYSLVYRELVNSNKALKESEEKYRLLFEFAPMGLGLVSMDGNFIEYNQTILNIIGYPKTELMKKKLEVIYQNPEDRIVFLRELMQKGFIKNFETKLIRGDGTASSVTKNAVLFPLNNKKVILTAMQDISDRKNMEENIRRAKEDAEAANRAKSEFLANMSHEFRTPLNAVLGYAQILKTDENLTAKQKESIDIIYKSGEHLLMLINDILDLSKIEAGKMELALSEFYMPGFIMNVAELTRISALRKGISFEYHADPDLPKCVSGDEVRLRQILINLLGNAVKFTRKGKVLFTVTRNDGKIRFHIKDTGIGISKEQFDIIFKPFTQLKQQQFQNEGTGLGLTISRKLIHMMGGELRLESIEGQGSKFWFDVHLPDISCKYGDNEQLENKKILGYKGRKMKILLADDDMVSRIMLKSILLKSGFEVIEADDGNKAVEKAAEYQPDLIFMDMIMPYKDGLEAAAQIRQMPCIKDLPIIAVSVNASYETRKAGIEAGCNEYFTKPVNMDNILEVLARYLKLEWIYENEYDNYSNNEESAGHDTLIPPPEDEVRAIYNLAMKGDVRRIQKLAEEHKSMKSEYKFFYEKIYRFSAEFMMDELQEFIKENMESKHE